MERRSGGQLGTVDEDDVGPATLGEVVGDARPADPTADDDRPCVFHRRSVAAGMPARSASAPDDAAYGWVSGGRSGETPVVGRSWRAATSRRGVDGTCGKRRAR